MTRICGFVVLILFFVSQSLLFGEAPKVLSDGEPLADWRLQPPKDLNGYFPFTPSNSVDEWNRRAEGIRTRILVSNGLWPLPTKTPLNPVVHGKITFDQYTVEKVYFQSMPGLFVTGNLYRPVDDNESHPGVLCPHGHFSDGRFGASGTDYVRRQITQGAERFEDGGQNSIQARCVMLAKLGCVVFNYDMIGYCDSAPISYHLGHRFAKQRESMNSYSDWGLYSPQAESHAQSVMGLQTYNSIRALDWLESLPDVDAKRIAVTGASGGGTQTFLLCAVDSRPAVSVPAVMVSTAMQGGCTCENCSLLRVGDAGNVTFAALFAPKPMCLLSADDWTVEMPTKGFPQLQHHYKLFGAQDKVRHVPLLHFGHNYNYVSRANMYSWLNKHLQLGHQEPIVEDAYKRLSRSELTVWNEEHPKPPATPEAEQTILKWWTDDAKRQLEQAASNASNYRHIVSGAHQTIVHRRAAEIGSLELTSISKQRYDDYIEISGLINHVTADGDELIPTVSLMPNDWSNGRAVIWIEEEGKKSLYTPNGQPAPAIRKLLDAGIAVIGADLFLQGEFLGRGIAADETRRVANPREAAAYTFGYNDSRFIRQVHDVLSVVAFAANHNRKPSHLSLVGVGKAGPVVAMARPACGEMVDVTVVDQSHGFRFGAIKRIHDPYFVPGAAKYDDIPGMLALAAPSRLHILGATAECERHVTSMYELFSAADAISFSTSADPQAIAEHVSR